MLQYTQDFFSLFKGHEEVYGTYRDSNLALKDEHAKGKPVTIRAHVNLTLWDNHLIGGDSLGIVPINADNNSWFGAININDYSIDVKAMCKKIKDNKLPLVPCISKSGGLHLYMFLLAAVPAITVREKLKTFSRILGVHNSEIYPKQTELLYERGDYGSWLNMPYHGESRPGLDYEGQKLSKEDFVKFAYNKAIMPKDLQNLRSYLDVKHPEAPPCIQYILANPIEEEDRETALFNIALYFKKIGPQKWKENIDKFNAVEFKPSLSSIDVVNIITKVSKWKRDYQCNTKLLKKYCDRGTCVKLAYGIAGVNTLQMSGLCKLLVSPVIWFVNVDLGGMRRLELSTEELQNQTKFQKVCMDTLNIMPPILKRNDWRKMISELLENVTLIDVSKDSTPTGEFLEHLENFCTSRHAAKSKDEILLGKPWLNDHFYYFRSKDLLSYLDKEKFFDFPRNKIYATLKDMKAKSEVFKIQGRAVRCWSLPVETEKIIKKETIENSEQ